MHIENVVLDGFSKKVGAKILATIKTNLSAKLSDHPAQIKQSGFITQIKTRPITINQKMNPTAIGNKAADAIYKSINF